ncbi:MAG TPA: aldolase/citrate lyase family protein [Gammaproteobacteria bacterium]|nr:aldolase/citrate lyase family protein [Gammaproteobacteria bacterium]
MARKKNKFAEQLRRGDLLIGTLVSLPSAEITELLASSGFDWLFIDAEHGAFNPQQAQTMLQAAGECPCVIRVPAADDIWIKKALDCGAAGIIVPQVHTADQARQIVNSAKYSPTGSRGVGIGRAHKYGIEFEDYLEKANRETAVIIQAESQAAVDNIDAIAKVKGIDAIFIGPYDLSASLGKTGQVTHKEVVRAINKVANACKSANVRAGIFGVNAAAVKPYIKTGFTLITAGVDTLLLIKSATEMLADLRGK